MPVIRIDDVVIEDNLGRKDDHTQEQIQTLADSMAKNGQLQPIILKPTKGLIAGYGRYQAAKLLGWDTIEYVQKGNASDDSSYESVAIAENLHRSELNQGERIVMTARYAKLHGIKAAMTVSGQKSLKKVQVMVNDIAAIEKVGGEQAVNLVKGVKTGKGVVRIAKAARNESQEEFEAELVTQLEKKDGERADSHDFAETFTTKFQQYRSGMEKLITESKNNGVRLTGAQLNMFEEAMDTFGMLEAYIEKSLKPKRNTRKTLSQKLAEIA